MNSCVLTAKIVRSPQLRYTQDSQLAIAEMMVEFESISPNTPPATLKVIAWGNLATEVEKNYTEGNQVVLAGRLTMNVVERQGYKEKIAEFTISQIQPLVSNSSNPPNPTPSHNVVNINKDYDDSLDEDHIMDDHQESYQPPQKDLDELPF